MKDGYKITRSQGGFLCRTFTKGFVPTYGSWGETARTAYYLEQWKNRLLSGSDVMRLNRCPLPGFQCGYPKVSDAFRKEIRARAEVCRLDVAA